MLPDKKGSNILIASKSLAFEQGSVAYLNHVGFEFSDILLDESNGHIISTQHTKNSTTIHLVKDFHLAHDILTRSLRRDRHIDVDAVFLESNPVIEINFSSSNAMLGFFALKLGNQPLSPHLYCVGQHATGMKERMVDYIVHNKGRSIKDWASNRITAWEGPSLREEIEKMGSEIERISESPTEPVIKFHFVYASSLKFQLVGTNLQ